MAFIILEINCNDEECTCGYCDGFDYYLSFCSLFNTKIEDNKRCQECLDAEILLSQENN